ncbi:dienelactone hydrolase family protein [Albimonas sp. CAU 1670]|uniref:dienelactone hydrolase family protein n=1 Tax=Albimonas sp. CAU 1670 TaxID=3032599 RepID=UPI0023DB22FA|nr:dienelactone hydrolase family protein [Albimonas sp. CAU 1670]MDF2234229.1 dienelactone hydrolase family protein [Albimonas sp. CAU 1670]
MRLTTAPLRYSDGETEFEGWWAAPADLTGPVPGVLMAPAFGGVGEQMKLNAERVAATGRPVLLLDPYGIESMADQTIDAMARMQGMVAARDVLQRRLLAALETLKARPEVDGARTAVCGYCFGGLCALDLARAAPEGLLGAVALHGVLSPSGLEAKKITASVLVLHGWDDPLATPDDVLALAREMDAAEADWQLHAYGGVVHAFTTPQANTPGRAVYDPRADRRSFAAMTDFFGEVLGAA